MTLVLLAGAAGACLAIALHKQVIASKPVPAFADTVTGANSVGPGFPDPTPWFIAAAVLALVALSAMFLAWRQRAVAKHG